MIYLRNSHFWNTFYFEWLLFYNAILVVSKLVKNLTSSFSFQSQSLIDHMTTVSVIQAFCDYKDKSPTERKMCLKRIKTMSRKGALEKE